MYAFSACRLRLGTSSRRTLALCLPGSGYAAGGGGGRHYGGGGGDGDGGGGGSAYG